MNKPYVVSDGILVLNLRPAGDGWYAVTSPIDPQLITQARSIEEAFEMAHDARKSLADARKQLAKRLSQIALSGSKSPSARAPSSPGPTKPIAKKASREKTA